MSRELLPLLVLLGAGAVVAVVALVVAQTRDWQTKAFLTFGNRVHLWVSDEVITAAVTRRLRLSASGAAIGALVGIGVALVIVLVSPAIQLRSLIYLVVFPIVLVSVTLIPVGLSLRDELYRHDDDAPRVARTIPVGVRDYLSPARFWAAPVFGFIAVVLLIVGVALSTTGRIEGQRFFASPALPWTVVVIFLLGLGWVAATRIVGGNQTATDGLELAWSDALRADALRNLWALGTLVAWLAVVTSGLGIVGALREPIAPTWAAIILQTSATWGGIIVGRVFNIGGAFSYFRYRLWPSLGDVGEIIDETAVETDATTERRP